MTDSGLLRDQIIRARNSLAFILVLAFVYCGIILWFHAQIEVGPAAWTTFVFALLTGFGFCLLRIWSKKNPFGAFVLTLCFVIVATAIVPFFLLEGDSESLKLRAYWIISILLMAILGIPVSRGMEAVLMERSEAEKGKRWRRGASILMMGSIFILIYGAVLGTIGEKDWIRSSDTVLRHQNNLEYLNRVIERLPNHPGGWRSRAEKKFQQRDYARARYDFQKAVAVAGSNWSGRWNCRFREAECWEILGERGEARQIYEKLKFDAPESWYRYDELQRKIDRLKH